MILDIPTLSVSSYLKQRKIYQKAARYLNTIEKPDTGNRAKPMFSPNMRCEKIQYILYKY